MNRYDRLLGFLSQPSRILRIQKRRVIVSAVFCALAASAGAFQNCGIQMARKPAATTGASNGSASLQGSAATTAGSNSSGTSNSSASPEPVQWLTINSYGPGTQSSSRRSIAASSELLLEWGCMYCSQADAPQVTSTGTCAAGNAIANAMGQHLSGQRVISARDWIGCDVNIVRSVRNSVGVSKTLNAYYAFTQSSSSAVLQWISMNGQLGGASAGSRTWINAAQNILLSWGCENCDRYDAPQISVSGSCSGRASLSLPLDQLRGQVTLTSSNGELAGCQVDITRTVRGSGGSSSTRTFTFDLARPTQIQPTDILGWVDGANPSGDSIIVTGWACARNTSAILNVHLYLGGPAGSGTFIGGYLADRAGETTIGTACGSSGSAHRFSIPISGALMAQHSGKAIYIHGIVPNGDNNPLLSGSGNYRLPTRQDASSETCTEAQYLERYPDVRAAGVNPWLHYTRFGRNEGRCRISGACSGTLNESEYWEVYNDVANVSANPFLHWADFGRNEGRCRVSGACTRSVTEPEYLRILAGFDGVNTSGINATEHYSRYGRSEGRCPLVSSQPVATPPASIPSTCTAGQYLEFYPDVARAGVNPFVHYQLAGRNEGRCRITDACSVTAAQYLEMYPDVAQAGVNPFVHYLTNGQSEGRCAINEPCTVDQAGYLALYSDIRNADVNPFLHYYQNGRQEGRCRLTGRCTAPVDANQYLELLRLMDGADTNGMNAQEHYDRYGRNEGRCPLSGSSGSSSSSASSSASSSEVYRYVWNLYMEANPDVVAARGMTPSAADEHFCTSMVYGGETRPLRPGGPAFRVDMDAFYAANPDLVALATDRDRIKEWLSCASSPTCTGTPAVKALQTWDQAADFQKKSVICMYTSAYSSNSRRLR